jgi:hypothetical protein|uniref:Uncharacterized protein n=1 Tax=Staphylococcus sp. 693-2 TaxID=373067 RepID=D2J5V1_9STAP|nr:hypothetical protein SAP008A_004 [Staphylococcus sp. 693-2]
MGEYKLLLKYVDFTVNKSKKIDLLTVKQYLNYCKFKSYDFGKDQ